MHKSMKEFTPGKSLFKVTHTATNTDVKLKKGDIVRLSSLNDLRYEGGLFILFRDDKTEKLHDLWIGDVKEILVPL